MRTPAFYSTLAWCAATRVRTRAQCVRARFACLTPRRSRMQQARRWKLENGKPREARQTAEFRGTCRYASIHSHRHEELGRRDDMWSLLYMLLELHGASLPWSNTRDHDQVLMLKEQQLRELLRLPMDSANFRTAGLELPGAFLEILRHLDDLDFYDSPDYAFIRATLVALVPSANGVPVQLNWAAEGISRDSRHILRHCAGRDGTTDEPPPTAPGQQTPQQPPQQQHGNGAPMPAGYPPGHTAHRGGQPTPPYPPQQLPGAVSTCARSKVSARVS